MKIDLTQHDLEQREQALDPSQSFIVQAPAGSGKTTLLIQRFLTLLTIVKKPEEILAITFTKKAANEMRLRVVNALKQALDENEPQSIHAKKTWFLAKQVLKRDQEYHWNIVNNPNQLRIQTIDSFCSYLTKQLPLLSHFGSQPNIAEAPISLYQEAVQEVISHVEEEFAWSGAIAKLLLHMDNDLNKLHDLLVNLLAKRDQWLSYIHFDLSADEIKKQLENNIALVIADHLKPIPTLFPKDLIPELLSTARFAANNLLLNKIDSNITACNNLTVLPNTQWSNYSTWKGIAALLLTDDKTWRKQVNTHLGFPAPSNVKNKQEKQLFSDFKQTALDLLSKLSNHENLRLALTKVLDLPLPYYDDNQWEILQALLQILKITAAQLRLVFQQHGQIDFIENTQAAILALGDDECPTDLALALDYQIKHILIDEFQDTSFTQYQLLEKLTIGWENNDGRTLFVVGDPMQSIYRFREAEVGLFIRMQARGIGNVRLTPLTLSVNFRSTQQIVDWNNYHFKNIFPCSNDIITGAVSYNPSVANQLFLIDKNPSTHSFVKTIGFLDTEGEIQAKHIIEIIKNEKKNNPNNKIAILVRARQHLKKIIPALKNANIPYQAIEIDPLAEKQHIQDLISLTSALLYPADRIAWLAILRAPWCGLTLADLLKLANNPYVTIFEQLMNEEILKNLSEGGKNRLQRIFPMLKIKIEERERYDLRSWVETTWNALGGPACLNDQNEIEDVNAFFRLLEEFGQYRESLSLKKLKTKIEKLFATPQHDDSILQIMTIHSAKGLEFDTVILPHLERKKTIDDHSLLLWMEYPLINNLVALLLAPIHATGNEKDSIYQFIQQQQEIKSDYEIDRLLYVAATRAKTNLYLLFDTYKKDNGNYAIESGSFLKRLWPHFEKQAASIILNQDTSMPAISSHTQKYIQRLHADWKNPVDEVLPIKITAHTKPGGFQLTNSNFKLIGTVVHRILQNLADKGIIWWTNTAQSEQLSYLKKILKQVGVLPEYLESSINMVQTILKNILNNQRGTWILESHQEAKSELAITAFIDGKLENLIIDRTFIDKSGIRWIIDYKTTLSEYHNLEEFLAREQKKYFEKMNQYAQAMRLMDNSRPIHLGLYFPTIPAWKEWVT